MAQPLTVIARLHAQPDQVAELGEALGLLVHQTRQESGCLNYDLYVSPEDPTLFVFHETWASRAHWEAHNEAPHIRAFRERGPELLAGEAEVDPLHKVD